MSTELREIAQAVEPVPLQEYLRSRGWMVEEDLSEKNGIVVYAKEGLSVDVPQRTDYADYGRRIAELLALLADIEHKSPFALADELTEPPGDVLGLRVDSALVRSGTLSLEGSIRLREGMRNLLLAAAHSAIVPRGYFPRLSHAEATRLLASVRDAQNQRGSFIARFIVPVEPAVSEAADLDNDPFGRQVTKLLMRALKGVHRVRSLGARDELLSMEKEGVSGNLLAALSTMSSAIGAGALELSVSWARNRNPPETIPSQVHFEAELLDGLDAVVDQMESGVRGLGERLEPADIPDFDIHGLLPPIAPGEREHSPERSPYPSDMLTFCHRFGMSSERRETLRGLLKLREELRNVGITDGFQWLGGSFCEDAERLREQPRIDIEVLTFAILGDADTQSAKRQAAPHVFDAGRSRARFRVDHHVLPADRGLDERYARRVAYWHSVWSHQRGSHRWKGFVSVPLVSNDDQADAWLDIADVMGLGDAR